MALKSIFYEKFYYRIDSMPLMLSNNIWTGRALYHEGH